MLTALDSLVALAVEHLPRADYTAITTRAPASRGGVSTAAATHDYPRLLDAVSRTCQEGPVFENSDHLAAGVYVSDLTNEARWPNFTRQATEHTPIRCALSYALFRTRDTAGVLTFYATTAGAFEPPARDLAYVITAHAAVLWRAAHNALQFRTALASRDTIGQAKGMLMERYGLTAEEAFDRLSTLSQQHNIKLNQVARRLIDADHPTRTTDACLRGATATFCDESTYSNN